MSTFLCITNGTMALGETYVIFRFARELREAGHQIVFVAPPYAAHYLAESGYECSFFGDDRKANAGMLEALVRDTKPDAILLADYYFFHISHYLRQTVDLIPLFKMGIPVGVFDNGNFYNVSKTGRFKNAFSHFTTTLPLPRLPPETAFLLKPCPPHAPHEQEKNVHRYRITTRRETRSADATRSAATREKVGCPPGAKLMLWPVPGYLYELRWSPRLHHVGFDAKGLTNYKVESDNPRRLPINNWYYHVNRLLVSYLDDLDGAVHLVNMCPYAEEYAAEPTDKVTIHNMGPTGFAEFDDLLLATDLYCIDNRFSTTLGRALFYPGQAACVISSLAIVRGHTTVEPSFALGARAHAAVREIERRHPRAIKPSYFSHIGWKHVLEGLIQGNPFSETYGLIDIFREDQCVDSLRGLLFDQERIAARTERKEGYLRDLETIPGPAEVCEIALRGHVSERVQPSED